MGKLLKSILMATALLVCTEASQKPMQIGSDFVCEHPSYTVTIVSKSPMVLYLHDFITPIERAHLQAVTYVSSSNTTR